MYGIDSTKLYSELCSMRLVHMWNLLRGNPHGSKFGTWGLLLHAYRLLVARQLLCSSIAEGVVLTSLARL